MATSRSNLPVVIVGGGLGGLSAALALGLAGREVHVIEQAHEIAPIGYGIQLGPNVFPVFDRLGVTDAVMKASHFPNSVMMGDALTGKVLIDASVKSPRFNERFKRPYVVIHRADIHNILLDACKRIPGIEVTVSATVTGFQQEGDGVKVFCDDGRVFEGEALIGADGVKSRIREAFAPNDAVRPNGYVAHRTIFDMKDVPAGTPFMDEVVLWGGPKYHVVHYPLRDRSIFNVVCVMKPSVTSGEQEFGSYADEVASTFRNACEPLKRLISKMDFERRWALADRDPIRNWSIGRSTLLGDAAHPTLQTYAQGACMAIEDADCLVAALQATGFDYARAFQAYRNERLVRTARVQLGSRTIWEFYHEADIAADVRNADALERTQEDFYNCVAWLWNGPAAPKFAA